MKRLSQALCVGVVYAVVYSLPALGIEVGGYAVSNHRPCGVSNLPATTAEMERFFADENFAEYFERNFYWTNNNVNQVDWAASTDYVEHSDTANGFDGVDASGLSYIASHGITSSDVYRASMGTSGAGGCEARSSQMMLGDQNLRYLILSTCQGVKIGTGDSPSRPGANPSRTWNPSRVNGLNCIFGYSNNMADADGYGVVFLNYMKNNEEPVADSFLRAGRAVASFNIPAVICFGATEEEAESRLTEDMVLSTETASGGASAYSYEVSRDLIKLTSGKLLVDRISVEPLALASSKLDSLSGLVSQNSKSGTVSYRRQAHYSTTPMTISDDATIAIAERYLRSNLVTEDMELVPVRIVDRGLARGLAEPRVIGKTVVFAQNMFEAYPLSTAGTVEIYVNGEAEVEGFHFALRQVSGVKTGKITSAPTREQLAASVESVLDIYRRRFPEASKIEFYKDSVGYDLGMDVERKTSANLVHQVVIEVTQGDYARRYVESVLLK